LHIEVYKKLTITVLLLPPSAFFSSLVSTEFLYGTTTPNTTETLTKMIGLLTMLLSLSYQYNKLDTVANQNTEKTTTKCYNSELSSTE